MERIKDKFTNINEIKDITYYYKRVSRFLFAGFVPQNEIIAAIQNRLYEFSKYRWWNEYKHKGHTVKRKSAKAHNMAAKYIVRNTFAEFPDITVKDKDTTEKILDILFDNGFNRNEKKAFETQIHLGGRIIKPYIEDSKMKLDFIDGDIVFVLDEDAQDINEIIVATFITKLEHNKKMFYTRLEWHYERDDKRYIQTELYRSRTSGKFQHLCNAIQYQRLFGAELINDGLEEFDIDVPTFVYIGNPNVNNKDVTSSESIGWFVDGWDSLMAVDEDVDAKSIEIKYGRMKTAVPETSSEGILVEDNSGKLQEERHYNPNDPEIFIYPSTMSDDGMPTILAPTLRIADQVMSLNTDLDLFSSNSGLDAGTLRFDGKTIQTATQVITEKSETAKTIKDFEESLEEGYKRLFILIQKLADKYMPGLTIPEFKHSDITINWKDNVIVDDGAEREFDMVLVDKVMMPEFRFLMQWKGMTEEEAKKSILEAQEAVAASRDFTPVDEIEFDEDGNPIVRDEEGNIIDNGDDE